MSEFDHNSGKMDSRVPESTVVSSFKPKGKLSLWMKLIFLFFVLLLCIVIAEGVVRLLPATQLGFEFDGEFFKAPKEFEKDAARNGPGYHDLPHTVKSFGTKRVLLLGDSYVAAISMKIPKTVGRRLAHYLNRASRQRFDVISCGAPGWGQRRQLEILRKRGPKLTPDVVVTLFMPFNDITDDSEELRAEAKRQYFNMKRYRPGWGKLASDEVPCFYLRWSALNRLLSYRLAERLGSGGSEEIPIDYLVYAEQQDDRWTKAWKITEDLILETREFTKSLHARYAIVSASTPHGVLGGGGGKGLEFLKRIYPGMKKGKWNLDKPNERMAAFCKENGIPFLSLEPAFREETKKGLRLHWKYDGHWNEAGNDLAGRLMAEFLLTTK